MSKKPMKQRSSTPADVELGTRIRTRRIEVGMSQDALGQKLGVSFQQIQKYEKGVNRVSSVRLMEIARALDIGTDYFIHVASKHESEFTPMIADKASQRLLTAFHRIDDSVTRYKIIGLLESMAA